YLSKLDNISVQKTPKVTMYLPLSIDVTNRWRNRFTNQNLSNILLLYVEQP
ncbi:hypothetical protein SNEBB_003912, partial [Seison nebaliae]